METAAASAVTNATRHSSPGVDGVADHVDGLCAAPPCKSVVS